MAHDPDSLTLELIAMLTETEAEGDPPSVPASERVYYQPNEESQLSYPCIVFSKDPAYRLHADNIVYRRMRRYELTLIDRKPDNPALDVLENRPYCAPVRSFVADGLHHDVFDLYY